MKSTKKFLIAAVAAVSALSMLSLAACGNGDEGEKEQPYTCTYKSPSQSYSVWQDKSMEDLQDESVSGKTITYQFAAHGTEGRKYSVLINLYSDGYAKMTQYNTEYQSGKNPTLANYYLGYWDYLEDNGYIYLGFSAYTYEGPTYEANNLVHGAVTDVSYSYQLTISNSTFDEFSVNACLGFASGGQYVRSTNVSGDGSTKYANEDAFKTYAASYWDSYVDPEPAE